MTDTASKPDTTNRVAVAWRGAARSSCLFSMRWSPRDLQGARYIGVKGRKVEVRIL